MVARQNAGESVHFKPHLLLTPVTPIHQAFKEVQEHFPDLRIWVYYGTPGAFVSGGADVFQTRRLIRKLKALDPGDPKVSENPNGRK